MQVMEYDLPAYWASYLINGDASGIESADKYEADKFLAVNDLPAPVSCEPAGFGQFYFSGQGKTLGCDLETFTFLI